MKVLNEKPHDPRRLWNIEDDGESTYVMAPTAEQALAFWRSEIGSEWGRPMTSDDWLTPPDNESPPMDCTRPVLLNPPYGWATRCKDCRGAGSLSMAYCGEPHLREPCGCDDGWCRMSWRTVRRIRRERRRRLRLLAKGWIAGCR